MYNCRIILVLLVFIMACTPDEQKIPIQNVEKKHEKKLDNLVVDTIISPTFTTANTTGNFSEGKGSEKKISTEKPNRNRVSQDLTHPFQTPVEFVDEASDPAFNYTSSDNCETILTDTMH